MTLLDFVEELEAKGVELTVSDDRLRYWGEKAVLTPETLARLKESKAEVIALQRERALRSTLCPVTYGQSALWFLHQLAPDSSAYNVGFAATIHSRVDSESLRRSLETLIARHASLRTTFPTRNGAPVQEIHSHAAPAFEVVAAALLSEEERETRVAAAYRAPFNLETGPLLRVHLFTSDEDRHVLLLTVHHMICDAWSLWLLLDEWAALYSAECNHTAANLPLVTATYADYARWQRPFLQGRDGERLWTYWKDSLKGELPVLNLPADHVRPAIQSFKGASFRFRLDASLTARIRSFASAEGTTVYTVLLAAFEVLLYRYTGQEEFVIGSPTSGRSQRQFAGVIGDFINTVVLRCSCAGNPPFREFLNRAGATALEAISHEDFPFPMLVERLQPGRESDRSPLFQVLFNFLKPQNFPEAIELWVANDAGKSISWAGLSLGPFPLAQQEGQTDLTLEMAEGDANLFGLLKYNVDLFDEPTIARMATHFETLLHSIIANADSRLSELPLIGDRERHQLLVEWNQSKAEFPREKCVHQLFEEQANRTPLATAALCDGVSLSYSDLNARANDLAAQLKAEGAVPGTIVGLCLERSLNMLVGLLGILKSGAAYLPLDPDHPQSRLDSILEDCRPELLVTQTSVVSKYQFGDRFGDADAVGNRTTPGTADEFLLLHLKSSRPRNDRKMSGDSGRTVGPDDLAYVIYTSGSTGRPKGVQLQHRGVVNFLTSMSREPGLTASDTILALTTVSFDIAVLELFLPITVGGRVVIAKRDATVDPERLRDLMLQSRATVLQATPATWRMLVDSGWQGDFKLKALIGGEAVPSELATQLLQRCASLWNMYGPTETTVWSATTRITSAERISLGRPIANTQLYVLHGEQLAPVGVPGELFIGGEGLARGYWNRADLTDQAFVPNRISSGDGPRLYKTGDLVRYRGDGSLDFLGRIDRQVKIRGYRIELGEIEAALRLHPSVKDAVVVVSEYPHGDQRLVAYFIPNGEAVAAAELRNHVASKVPEYMVPAAFVRLDKFPLTGSGKIDGKALPKPVQEQRGTIVSRTALSPTQETLLEIWKDLLAADKIGLDDNLFHIGGHSLISVRLVLMIQQRLGVKLAVMDVFTYPTIREMSAIVEFHAKTRVAEVVSPAAMLAVPDTNGTVKNMREPANGGLRRKLGLGSESIVQGPLNRILQLAARAAPGVLRNVFHRWRGVRLGNDVLIGYDTIIETSYPWLVAIGDHSSIGMRVTIIGHFLGMERETRTKNGITVQIGNNVWIGPGSLILPNLTIGDGSVVAAGSVVTRSVPPGTMVQGNPAVAVAKCPIPIKPGMPFDEFVKNLQPLG